MVFAPGVAPILADAATYAGAVALGHAMMRFIAGPARDDQLTRGCTTAATLLSAG
jgi:hypothetical protein